MARKVSPPALRVRRKGKEEGGGHRDLAGLRSWFHSHDYGGVTEGPQGPAVVPVAETQQLDAGEKAPAPKEAAPCNEEKERLWQNNTAPVQGPRSSSACVGVGR